ncbi:MAG: hypothetical protein JNM88_16315 [Chitinophagaceae bacterium]|nr:hypothetical protein [Chitinophagaceae bacterium]
MSVHSSFISGSIPYKLYKEGDELFCHWLDVNGTRFREPFFDETILRCRALPQNQHRHKCVSQVSELPGWAADISAIAPAAIIFHVSRCGSTMLTQLLSLNEQNIVLPEVPFFDELLRLQYQQEVVSTSTADEYLQAAVKFYGQPKNGQEQHLFIKTDCWHILFWERWRKLYPGVPFILLYRSPDEVVRSQQKRQGIQAVPGMLELAMFGIAAEQIRYHDFGHYFSMVLEKLYTKFLQVAQEDEQAILINYKDGMIPAVKRIAAAGNMELANELLEKKTERTRYHAKYPEQSFGGDSKPTVELPDLSACNKLYEQIEEIRMSIRQ